MWKLLFSDNTLWGLLNFRGGVIRHFIKEGYRIILVAPQDSMADLTLIPNEVKYIPVKLNRTGTNPFSDFQYYKVLRQIYKREKPDYIFHYTIKPNIYGTLAAHGLVICSSAMIPGLGHVYTEKSIGNMIARIMYKFAMRYPQKVLVLNKVNYDILVHRKVVAPEKLLWLKGGEGVDLSKYKSTPPPRNKRPVFLMIARLLYEKGYAEYIEAAKVLKEQAEFRVMGPIDSHPTAVKRETIDNDVANGIIRYIEFSLDVVSQIEAADCVVLPSFYGEGLSRVLMEGLAMARSIIASDIPGCRETVQSGINGYLCAPKDAQSLIEVCKKFIALSPEQRKRMGIESRILAEKQFDEQLVIKQYQRILKDYFGT